MKPLLYLEIRQFINAIKSTLRTPKRLIPALIMAAGAFAWAMQALLFSFSVHGLSHRHAQAMALAAGVLPGELIRAGAFLALSIGSVIVLYQAFASGSLVFSIAHIDFLFPTPIARRYVLLVKLVKDYLKYAFWVAFFVTFLGSPICLSLRLSVFPGGLITIAALTGYMLFVVNVAHTLNIVLTFGYERLKQAGTAIKLALVLVFGSVIVYGLESFIRTGGSLDDMFLAAANSPVVRTVFAPADWAANLALTPLIPVGHKEMAYLPVIWILALVSFVLLMSRNENIYEPSLGVSVRASRLRVAMRSGDQTAIRTEVMREKGSRKAGRFIIPPFGRGAVALLWKSLLVRYRMSAGQALLMLLLPAMIALVAQHTFAQKKEFLSYIPLMLLYISFVLSMTVQPQIRAELKQANILKSMPIAGWKVMLTMAVNGSAYLAMGILVFASALWLLIPASRTSLLPTCAIAAPFIGFACISATIISALMYPDTRDSTQNFTCNLIGLIMISIAAMPTIVIAALMLFGAKASLWATLAPICAANLIIGGAAVVISGEIFRRFDPTSE